MKSDPAFRRNLLIVAALHVAFVGALYLAGKLQPKPKVETITWLDGGSIGGGEPGAGEPEPPTPEPEAPPPLPELPPPEPAPAPTLITPPPPSEIAVATPAPATPKPETPRPATPKPATPKPATPKPVTPRTTPKPKPKATPKTTPKPAAEETGKPKSSPSEKPKGTPGAAKTSDTIASAGSGNSTAKGGGNGAGTGNGKGPGKAGGGTGASEFGWYFSMIRDRFMARWVQPTDIQRGGADVITMVKLRINADGTIASHEVVRESGYPQMEESVLRAVEKVQQIDPLPAGLSSDGFLDVPLQFKLDQGQ